MKNLKEFYYKDYFGEINFSYLLEKDAKAEKKIANGIKSKNKKLCDEKFDEKIPKPELVNSCILTKVCYPGLVTGVGIGHEASIEGEFKLGMHFDHTYGQPIIYGSSVKGVLRHYFKECYSGTEEEANELIKDIFGSDDPRDGGKSLYDRDIFFDAVIVKGDKNGHILAPDSITPHTGGPLKNPIPITFVKIASGCTLEFRFRLVDSVIGDKTFTAEEKKKLFAEILTTFGVGAKTNVGYGQLVEVKSK